MDKEPDKTYIATWRSRALRWDYIHFDTGEIEVLAKTSKTKETRFVKMEEPLVDWLLPFRKRRGLVVGQNFQKALRAVKSSAGYGASRKSGKTWPKDVLRHTFGTYWLAMHQDRARLGEQMGNTIEVIKKHYRRAVSTLNDWKRAIAQQFISSATMAATSSTPSRR